MTFVRALRSLVAATGDLLVPHCCPLCGGDGSGHTGGICSPCLAGLGLHDGPVCPRCGAPAGPFAADATGCVHCRSDRFAFRSARAIGAYDGPLKVSVIAGKRAPGRVLAAALAEVVVDRQAGWLSETGIEIVIPVPTHWTHRIRGGHSAPLLMARVLGTAIGAAVCEDVLHKRRRTPRQTSLTPTERRRNLVDAFSVADPHRIDDRRILLVDDVLTTGRTASQCSRALLAAGARTVDVAVLARGVGI